MEKKEILLNLISSMFKTLVIPNPSSGNFVKSRQGLFPSCGHIRNLDPKSLGIDIDNDFEPNYVVESDKRQVIQKLKQEVKQCNKILLATDIDREGEAIAWHLVNVLRLDKKDTKRIRFTEITKKAILKAVKNLEKLISVRCLRLASILDRQTDTKSPHPGTNQQFITQR